MLSASECLWGETKAGSMSSDLPLSDLELPLVIIIREFIYLGLNLIMLIAPALQLNEYTIMSI